MLITFTLSLRAIGRLATAVAMLALSYAQADTVHPLPYDLLYVRAAYKGASGGANNTIWPDTVRPLTPEAGAQLVLLHSNGQREVIFPLEQYRGQIDTPLATVLSAGSVSDPNVSFDTQWVVFTWYHDLSDTNPQRDNLSHLGADLYKLHLKTRQLVRLTQQGFTPNTGNSANFDPQSSSSNYPRIGIFNTGATFAPNNQIVFTSTRNNLLPPKAFNTGQRVLQLFRMEDNGNNVELIGHLNLAMALHPQILLDGRIAFSSWEEQGIRDSRQFALWVIGPDGRQWNSLSGFSELALVHHFMTQLPGGDLVVTRYYNQNNNGFGDLIRYPLDPTGPDYATADPSPGSGIIPFQRTAQIGLTPFTTADDFPAPCPGHEDNPYASIPIDTCPSANRRGKFTQPAATPSAYGDSGKADLLAVYAPGPANHNGIYVGTGVDFPWYHGEIVLLPDAQAIPVPPAGTPGRPPQLQTIVAEDLYNLQWPRPVITFQQLYGMAEPAAWPELSDATIRAERLTPGEPFGLLGSSSLIWRDTEPAQALPWLSDRDPFNFTAEQSYRWIHQGADSGIYSDDAIYAVRIVMQQAQTDRSYPNNGAQFYVVGGERMRILGEIPVRKPGNPMVVLPDNSVVADTSFLAKVPADTSMTFQAIDRRGMVLNMAQTWHQVRPGEARYDCGGCHAHSKAPLDFAATAAAQPGYVIPDLAHTTPLLTVNSGGQTSLTTLSTATTTVEYFRDIAPILQTRCASCHSAISPAANLPLASNTPSIDRDGRTWPGAYYRLIRDSNAEFTPAPPAGGENYYLEPQLTHYVRAFQSRQSVLIWKLWGERLDGRANTDRNDDVDYIGSASHPNGIGVTGMPNDEKLTITRWLDLGAPIEFTRNWGFLEDDLRSSLVLRPTLAQARVSGTISQLQISSFDVESGIDTASLDVRCDHSLGAAPANSNLATGAILDAQGGLLTLPLPRALTLTEVATIIVQVRDIAGHTTTITRTYAPSDRIFSNGFE